MPCAVCGGRSIKTETGERCMKPSCEGASETASIDVKEMKCGCGKLMKYHGLNQLGHAIYKCLPCKKTMTN